MEKTVPERPGVAYIETGDPFGKSPSACRRAEWRDQIYSESEVIFCEKGFNVEG